MRLSEIYFKLAKYRNELTLIYSKNQTISKYEIVNLNIINQILHELKQYDIFQPDIEPLEKHKNYFAIAYPNALIDFDAYKKYDQAIQKIQAKLDMLSYLYNLTSKKLEDKTLCFSIPQNYDLKDLQEFSNNITKSLSQISNISKFEGEVTFKGVESGSDWFYFAISSVSLLFVLDRILKIAKNATINSAIAYHALKAMKAQNESIFNLLKIQKTIVKDYVENDDTFKNLDTEELNTVINACTMLSKEISKGTKAEIVLLNKAKSFEDIATDDLLENTIKNLKLLQESSQRQEPTENNAADKNSDHDAE